MHFPEMEQIILFESRARGTTDRIIIEVPTKREFSPSGKIFGWRNGRHRIPFNTSRLTLTGPGHSLSAWPARQPIGFVTIHPVVQDVSSEHDGDDDPFLTGSTHAATLPRRCPLQPLLPFRPLSQTGTWAIFNATRETPVIPSSGPGETHVWAGATRLGFGVVESVSIHTYEAFRPDLPPSRVDQPPSAKGHRRSDASYPESRPQREHPTRQ